MWTSACIEFRLIEPEEILFQAILDLYPEGNGGDLLFILEPDEIELFWERLGGSMFDLFMMILRRKVRSDGILRYKENSPPGIGTRTFMTYYEPNRAYSN